MAQAATLYPDHIVNSGFEYPDIRPYMGTVSNWVQINPDDKTAFAEGQSARTSIPSLNPITHGWKSNQTYSSGNWAHAGDIQYMKEIKGVGSRKDNQYVELTSNQAKTYIYQDVSTPHKGYVYKWQLDHCARDAAVNKMRVKIGKPGSETIQTAWRVTSNGSGLVDEEMTVIATDNSADKFKTGFGDDNRNGWFETYEGVYVIPDGQTVTRFTFESLDESSASGNCLDNIFFAICHPLYYDLRGGMGNLPSPQPSGRYSGYYPQDSMQLLSDVVPSREGYTFLGWADAPYDDVTSATQLPSIDFVKSKTIKAGDNRVYAVWAKNPIVTFKDSVTGKILSQTTIAFNTVLSENELPSVPSYEGYAFKGFSFPITDAISSDTEIQLLYDPVAIIKVNVKWVDRDNVLGLRPDLELSIPNSVDATQVITFHIDETDADVQSTFNPDEFSPPEDFALPDISPYEIKIHSHSDKNVNGIRTVIYDLRAVFIPVKDVTITKIWNDMSNVYGERPQSIIVDVYKYNPNVPADTEEELNEEMFWDLYDTVIITDSNAAVEDSGGNIWTYTMKDVPIWTATGYSADHLIDAEYKVVERDVSGYHISSIIGNIQEGDFAIENTIAKHIEMPQVGENGGMIIMIIGMFFIGISILLSTLQYLENNKAQ